MKKLWKPLAILLVAALAASLSLFAACDNEEPGEALSGTMTFVMDDKNGTIETVEANLDGFTSNDTAIDVIDKLAEDGVVCYTSSKGVPGIMLTGIGIVEDGTDYQGNPAKGYNYIVQQDNAAGVYLYIYTNVDADKNDYEGMTTVEYEGETLAESLNGIDKMTIEDGAVIYITTIVWG